MIKVATVFSGIGAIEQALKRMNIKNKIIFACDNGGVDIFKKQINDNFLEIEQEMISLKKQLDNLKLPNFEDYIENINQKLEVIKKNFKNLKNKIEDLELPFTEISNSIDKISRYLVKNKINIKEINKYLERELDISEKLILVNEFPKFLKKIKDYEKFEIYSDVNFLKELTKNKTYRKIRREIKEISKLLSELHGTIGTLRVLAHLSTLENPREKKDYVDTLYSHKLKSNFVRKSYLANYSLDESHFHWNVSFLDGSEYKGKVGLFVGGSPCQSFSMVGKRKGFEDTRGTLFYEYVRLLNEIQPRFFIYENVQGVLSHDKGKTWEVMQEAFKDLGYNFKYYILNSKRFGIPQNRNRLFVIGFKNIEDMKKFQTPKEQELKYKMQDFLEDVVEGKYFLPKKGIQFVTDSKNLEKKYTQINGEIALCQKANQQFNWHGDFIEYCSKEEFERFSKIDEKYFLSEKVKDYVLSEENSLIKPETDLKVARPLTATMHKMHRAGVDNYISYGQKLPVSDRKIRKLTPRECFRLMGFSDDFKIVVSDTQAYQQAGNSIVVDVLISIMEELNKIVL